MTMSCAGTIILRGSHALRFCGRARQTALYAQKRCTDTTHLIPSPTFRGNALEAHVLLHVAIWTARSPQEVRCDQKLIVTRKLAPVPSIDRVPRRAAYRLKATAIRWQLLSHRSPVLFVRVPWQRPQTAQVNGATARRRVSTHPSPGTDANCVLRTGSVAN
jgi:hypothetical protein